MKKLDRRTALKYSLGATLIGFTAANIISCNQEKPADSKSDSKTEEPDYSLQQQITDLSIPSVITVIGCGGFGAWPAFLSALSGVKKLILIDMADVDRLDLARAPFLANQIGISKSEALASMIKQFRPSVEIKQHKMMFTMKDTNLIEGTIFDGTNDIELARNLPIYAKENNLKYLTGFYNGNIAGTFDKHYEDLTFESGKQIPVWIGSAAFGGLMSMYSGYVRSIDYIGNPVEIAKGQSNVVEAIQAMGNQGAK